ncbi:hypothetical protein BM1_02061 [Bipolaris maydis]|nr:hypothetical protein BM1_02061 [Bipolaris maydis]
MAPRTEHEPKKHHCVNPGARDRPYLNAHTGAGVNKHRPASGRSNACVSSTFKSSHQGSQSRSRYVRVSSPDVDAVEHHPKIRDEHHGKNGSNGTGKLHAQHHNTRLVNSHDYDGDPKASATPRLPIKKHSSTSSSSPTTTQAPSTSTIKPLSTSTSTRDIIAIPKPLFARRRHCTDPVKRAFTNHNLRAILSDKPWPTQRKKASAEKMVLKMGIRKEYK